jgi:hypothetical protein
MRAPAASAAARVTVGVRRGLTATISPAFLKIRVRLG